MIFKSSFPNAPTVNMVIDGVSVDYTTIDSLVIKSSENEHDYAELSVVGLVPDYVTDYIDRPVYISIEYSPTQVSTFYGYVAFVTPEAVTRKGYVNKSPLQKTIISCLGSSYDMKAKKSRVWENVTLVQVVEKIAKEYKYSYQVPNDDFVFSRVKQSNESDAELLIKLCKSFGYRVTFSGAHIHIYDPYKSVSRNMPYAELTTLFGNEANFTFLPGRVLEFTGTFGYLTPEGKSNQYKIETLDQNGGVITYTTSNGGMGVGDPLPARFVDSIPISLVSYASAKKFGDSLVRNNIPFNAKAVVTGVPELMPGALIRLDKYDAKFDGFWMVSGVTQSVSRSNYITELDLVKDSLKNDEPIIFRGSPYIFPEPPVLNNERWISDKLLSSVYT
jgi:hypothetical protein